MSNLDNIDSSRGNNTVRHSVAECRRRVQVFQRRSIAAIFLCLALLCISFFLMMQFELNDAKHLRVVGGIGSLVSGFLACIGLVAYLSSLSRRDGLRCGNCNSLIEPPKFYLAIAFHCCPDCRAPFFREWDTQFEAESPISKVLFTVAEIERAEGARKRVFAQALIMIVAVTAGVVAVSSLMAWSFTKTLDERYGDAAQIVAAAIRVFPAYVVFSVGLIWAMRRARKAFATPCPGCGVGLQKSQLLCLTGNCIHCGHHVLNDVPTLKESPDGGDALVQRSVFAAQLARCKNRAVCTILLILGLGNIAAFTVLFWWTGKSRFSDQFTSREFAIVMLGLLATIIVIAWVDHRFKAGVCCPHCHGALLGLPNTVQATGNCFHCGQRVLPPPEAARSLENS